MSQSGIEVQVAVSGVDEVDERFEALKAATFEACRNIVEKGTIIVGDAAKRVFRGFPGGQRTSHITGHIWYSYAQPYEAHPPVPTSRSGNLQKSIGQLSIEPVGDSGYEGKVGSKLLYAPFVEFGTRKMVKFPYMAPALESSLMVLKALYEDEFTRAIEEVTNG